MIRLINIWLKHLFLIIQKLLRIIINYQISKSEDYLNSVLILKFFINSNSILKIYYMIFTIFNLELAKLINFSSLYILVHGWPFHTYFLNFLRITLIGNLTLQ